MDKIFAISDIHGSYEAFAEMLDNWNRKEERLIILGDMIDRGKDSLKVVQKVMELKNLYGKQVVALMGNHEQMFLDFLREPKEYGELYAYNGGNQTLISFLPDEYVMYMSYAERADKLLNNRWDEYLFIEGLKCFYEFGKLLFVHAGVHMELKHWAETPDNYMVWDRTMRFTKNTTGKKIVFGHTPTRTIHADTNNNDIWISEENKYVCIDGGCAYKGQLNGVVFNKRGDIVRKYATSMSLEKKSS